MAEKKADFEKRIRNEGAKMREESRQERIRRTKEITQRWKNGYAALKQENDSLQMESSKWFDRETTELNELQKLQLSEPPPEGILKSDWVKGIYEDFGKMKMNARDERDDKIKAISERWRAGFKTLKEENDRLQKELNDWWELDKLQIQNYVLENIERGYGF